jgi:subtilase family serine protease
MLKQKLFIAIGVIALLGTLLISMGAAPSDMPRQGRPEQPQLGYARAPVYFNAVATPIGLNERGTNTLSTTSTAPPYTPANIQQAYSFGSFAQGATGKVIAIVDAYGDPNLASDVATFDRYFSIGSIKLNIFYPDGQPRGRDSNWAIETALDVEWAHANAPAATIDVVVAPDASFAHLLDAINYAATIPSVSVAAISMSWGAPESQMSSSVINQYESAFGNITTKGIVLLAASGDQGATDGTRSLTTDYPASSPEVIGVGGTTLTVKSSSGVYSSETAWSSSGGGYSAKFSEPLYQSKAGISISGRGVPDVAFDANPNTGVYVYCSPYWYEVGGTSVGAPNWAAIVADSAAAGRALNLGYLYGTVYGNATLYANEIHDILSGNNGSPGYKAGTGWDAVTGIGTPNVSNLISGK